MSSIHDQENVFDGHENASETRKVEAKLARCLLRTEGQTNQVSCEHDTCWPQGKSREEQHYVPAVGCESQAHWMTTSV